MMPNLIVDRSLFEAFIDQINILQSFTIVIVCVVGWAIFLRQKRTLANYKKIILGVLIALVVFILLGRIVALLLVGTLLILMGWEIVTITGLENKLFHEQQRFKILVGDVAILSLYFWSALTLISMIVGSVNIAISVIQGPQVVSATMVGKYYIHRGSIELVFSGPEQGMWSPSGYQDVALSDEYYEGFDEYACYRLTYYQSPYDSLIGRSKIYVTQIGQSDECRK